MPIYEYECPRCSLRFEIKRSFNENGSGHCCPRCQCEARRIFSPTAIIFKGPGFYVTDSAADRGHLSEEASPKDTEKKTKSSPSAKSP